MIVDDVVYCDEPMFSDGLLAQDGGQGRLRGRGVLLVGRQQRPRGLQANYDPISLAQARKLVAAGKENIDLDELGDARCAGKSFHNFHNRRRQHQLLAAFTRSSATTS